MNDGDPSSWGEESSQSSYRGPDHEPVRCELCFKWIPRRTDKCSHCHRTEYQYSNELTEDRKLPAGNLSHEDSDRRIAEELQRQLDHRTDQDLQLARELQEQHDREEAARLLFAQELQEQRDREEAARLLFELEQEQNYPLPELDRFLP